MIFLCMILVVCWINKNCKGDFYFHAGEYEACRRKGHRKVMIINMRVCRELVQRYMTNLQRSFFRLFFLLFSITAFPKHNGLHE